MRIDRFTGAPRLVVGAAAAISLVGCTPSQLDQLTGNNTSPVQFKSPSGELAVRDDQTMPIQYTVTADHAVTARLVLDVDDIDGNGNETQLADDQVFQAPGGEANVSVDAGKFPYGTYRLRVILSDNLGSTGYSPDGAVHVVPLVDNGSDDNAEGLNMLPDVEGMRLLNTSGMPGTVNGRVPFVATWSTPDSKDNNLAPVYIAPIQIDSAMTVSRMQFYVFSHHPEAAAKQLEIYGGDGSLMKQVKVVMGSSATGGWNMVTINPPVKLQPGAYGVSFHGEAECSENWAANAGGGTGKASISGFPGQAYVPVTSNDLGFTPNFTVRILGNYDKENGGLLQTGLALAIDPPAEPTPDNSFTGEGPKPGKTDCDEGEDEVGAKSPFHVTWQIVP